MPIFAPLTRASRLMLVLGCALTMVASLAPASAADDEEEEVSFEGKVIRKLLGTGRPDIEYRERSPLVIPPSGTLPPPDSTAAASRTPAWPRDPDAKRRHRQADGPAIDAVREGGRALTPEEIRQGKVAGRSREAPAATLSDNQMARPLTPNELGETKSVFSWFSSKPETEEKFVKEPTRTKLTEPPTGYRTPSDGQPYAPPKDSGGSWFKPFNLMDRGTSEPR